MAVKLNVRRIGRMARKRRIRKTVEGSEARPRLSVFRSLCYTYAQLIADDSARTLLTVSTKSLGLPEKKARSVEGAKALGQKLAELAKERKIDQVVFDRNGYRYHGRVKAVAEGAREKGLRL